MAVADISTSMVVDVSDLLDQARQRGDFVMFEGAQVCRWISTTVLIRT